MSKVVQIKGQHMSPKTMLAQLLESAVGIEDFAAVINYKNGDTEVVSTAMKNERMTWLRWVFFEKFRPQPCTCETDTEDSAG